MVVRNSDPVRQDVTRPPIEFIEYSWIWQWFGCLSSGLAYMHNQGIRHQDIKPSNIIHRRQRIFFTDFSSSSRFDIGRTTSTENPARISAMYGAPEVVQSLQDNSDFRKHGRGTDIFSLGCVFLEMLTVIDGRLIDDFYEFCLATSTSPKRPTRLGANNFPGNFLYSRAVNLVPYWFDNSPYTVKSFLQECIMPMLLPERMERPSASDVSRKVRERSPWFTVHKSYCCCEE